MGSPVELLDWAAARFEVRQKRHISAHKGNFYKICFVTAFGVDIRYMFYHMLGNMCRHVLQLL